MLISAVPCYKLVLLLLIVVVAAIFRFIALDYAPSGGHGDVAWVGINALDWVDNGIWPFYVRELYAPEFFPVYLTGLLIPLIRQESKSMNKEDDIARVEDSQDEDEWETRTPLDSLLMDRESEEDFDQPPVRLTVRIVPPGLQLAFRLFSAEARVSYSAVQRICTKHGIQLLREDSRFKSLSGIVREVGWARLMTSDVDLLDDIEFTGQFQPTNARRTRADFSLYWRVRRDLAELAFDLGLPISHVILPCCYLSLSTIEGLGRYQDMLDSDIERLWRYVERRKKLIED